MKKIFSNGIRFEVCRDSIRKNCQIASRSSTGWTFALTGLSHKSQHNYHLAWRNSCLWLCVVYDTRSLYHNGMYRRWNTEPALTGFGRISHWYVALKKVLKKDFQSKWGSGLRRICILNFMTTYSAYVLL